MSEKNRKKLAVKLQKQGKKSGQKIWIDLADKITKPKRNLAKVNLWRLSKIALKQKEKVFVVPGHILGTGELTSGLRVAAFSFSKTAKEKIKNAKGQAFLLDELAESGEKTSSMVMVK